MRDHQAQLMTELIHENKSKSILELGFKHGVSSCYIAAALDSLGDGHLTTIDLKSAEGVTPNIHQLLGELGLESRVTPIFESTSYNWRLMKMIEQVPMPVFDFCYIDGAHNWSTDGFAFFLVDKMLTPGGLIVFDDLEWTHAKSPTLRGSDYLRDMSEEEKDCAQIRKMYELLVKTHPNYDGFATKGSWAWARKRADIAIEESQQVRREIVYQKEYVGFGGLMIKAARKFGLR